jgi:ATP-dependent RNA helicase DDX50
MSPALSRDAQAIHGDISQNRRESTLLGFRKGQFRCLIATDVAARGLDIPDVELVVETFYPRDAESYIHRSGRTGRAGKSGTSIILFQSENRGFLNFLARKIGTKIETIYPPSAQMSGQETGAILSKVKSSIDKSAQGSAQWLQIAEKLHAEHGHSPLAHLLMKSFGSEYAPRSILTSALNCATVVLNGVTEITRPAVMNRIARAIGEQDIDAGRMETFKGGVAIDVSIAVADKLQKQLLKDPQLKAIFSIPSELPVDLIRQYPTFREEQNMQSSSGRGRGYGGSSGRYGGGSSRSSSYGSGSGARYGYNKDNNTSWSSNYRSRDSQGSSSYSRDRSNSSGSSYNNNSVNSYSSYDRPRSYSQPGR